MKPNTMSSAFTFSRAASTMAFFAHMVEPLL
jgi:hypothetical protein